MRKVLLSLLVIFVLLLVGCGNKGKTKQSVELIVRDGYIMWKITDDDSWKNLISLEELTGEKGTDGRNIVFIIEDDYIKWKYEGSTSWSNLISITDLLGQKGIEAKQINLKVESGYVKWQYEGDTTWNNLISVLEFTGPQGEDGKDVSFRVFEGYIQWQYEEENNWKNLIEIDLITGQSGEGILSMEISDEGDLIVYFEDGSTSSLGIVYKTYQVLFKDYNGQVLDVQYVYPGKDAIEPEKPLRQGYEFDGWDKSLDNIQSNTEVFATYKIKTYIVTLLDEQDNIIDTHEVEYGSTLTLPFLTNDNYEFVGWFTSKDSYAEQVFNLTPITTDLILYPHFKEIEYPRKYQYATNDDFLGEEDGEFVYIGNADYVIIPEYIKGIKITKTNNDASTYLFMNRNDIKGVVFEGNNITDMKNLFRRNTSKTLDLTYLKTNNVTNMESMFFQSNVNSLDLRGFDTSKVVNMNSMFYETKATTLDLSTFNTSNVVDMSYMFSYTKALTLDLSSFDTSNVTNMESNRN